MKYYLGFHLENGRLLVSLPEYKSLACTQSIYHIVSEGGNLFDNLEAFIGKLIYLGAAITQVMHFLRSIDENYVKIRRLVKL